MTPRSAPGLRTIVALGATRRAALPGPAAFAVVCALAAVAALAVAVVVVKPDTLANDVWTYVAAGERLNAGHLLYRLSPGDRAIASDPPYWTSPLMYPPLIAVLWRPLVAISSNAAAFVFWITSAIAVIAGTAVLARRRPYAVAIAIAVLSYALALQVVVGNIDALILLGFVVVWASGRERHERTVGSLIGLMTSIKLTPVFLIWWLVVGGRWQALRWAAATILGCCLVSVLGAGVSSHSDYLGILRQVASAPPSPLSLPGMAIQFLGVPPDFAEVLAPAIAIAVGAAMLMLRDRPGAAFALAAFGSIYGSPSVWPSQLTRLLACIAPWSAPVRQGLSPARSATAEPVRAHSHVGGVSARESVADPPRSAPWGA